MQNLLQALEIIENEHKEFFEKKNLRAFQYVMICQKPVMIRFNEEVDGRCKLPEDVYRKIYTLVCSYYGLEPSFRTL
jgi:hypothetical protein